MQVISGQFMPEMQEDEEIDKRKDGSGPPRIPNRLIVAREVQGKHPDELYGSKFRPYMLTDMIARALIKEEEAQLP